MKKVINGKLYNTDTAKRIASWSNDQYPNDFRFCEEDLYITKKGAFFVHGSGGAMSQWAVHCSNGRMGSEGIISMSKSEALDWCEEHEIDADVIAEHFEIQEA